MNNITITKSYWACVSGGKDSLYMLNLILHNLELYPLNGVIHYELEIDYPFIKNVIDYMESECKKHNIPFLRIKPRKTWNELYNKYGFPARNNRWCLRTYKLDCAKQLKEIMKCQNKKVISYIGYCYDEDKRYKKRNTNDEIYPLVDFKINENIILEWAKTIPLFNDYYKYNRRCGCMYCPFQSMMSSAYLYKHYPEQFEFMINKMRETELNIEHKSGIPFSVISSNPDRDSRYLEHIVKTKWIKKLNEME